MVGVLTLSLGKKGSICIASIQDGDLDLVFLHHLGTLVILMTLLLSSVKTLSRLLHSNTTCKNIQIFLFFAMKMSCLTKLLIQILEQSGSNMFKVQSQQWSKSSFYSLYKISEPSRPGVYNTKTITVNATHFHQFLTVLLKQPNSEWSLSQHVLLDC